MGGKKQVTPKDSMIYIFKTKMRPIYVFIYVEKKYKKKDNNVNNGNA